MYSKENLKKIAKMNQLAPDVMKAFWAFDKAAVAAGAIPVKFKELIAVGDMPISRAMARMEAAAACAAGT